MIALLLFLFFGILVPLAMVWYGFVLMKLWDWFILPTFTSAPVLTITSAIGVSIVVSYLTHQHKIDDDDDIADSQYWIKQTLTMFFIPLWMLIVGAVVKQFM